MMNRNAIIGKLNLQVQNTRGEIQPSCLAYRSRVTSDSGNRRTQPQTGAASLRYYYAFFQPPGQEKPAKPVIEK